MARWLLLSCLVFWSGPAARAADPSLPRRENILPPGTARPSAPPDALAVLRASLEPPQAPYSAELSVERREGPEGKVLARRLAVRFSPPDLYRREILGPTGETLQLIVEDGRNEWIYDPARRKVWQGEPADPLFKRFGPEEEFDRLSENYDVAIATGEPVAGRSTWLLTLRARSDGALARRLWVDRRSSLLLRTEAFRPDGSAADSMRFGRLQFEPPQDRELFRFSPPSGSTVVKRVEPDYLALDEAKAAGVEPRLPAWLPSGYVFESLDVMAKGRHNIVHYRFSDGIEVLSLFQCPPRVRLNLGARLSRRVKLSVGRGYRTRTAEGNVLSWSSGGWRFVLVGSASDETLKRVAESVR
jgi:outer membrane lipoprotein-sorting protein